MSKQIVIANINLAIDIPEKLSSSADPDLFETKGYLHDGVSYFVTFAGKNILKAISKSGINRSCLLENTPFGSVISFNFMLPGFNPHTQFIVDLNVSSEFQLLFLQRLSLQTEIKQFIVDVKNGKVFSSTQLVDKREQMVLASFIEQGRQHNETISSIDFDKASDFRD